MKSENSVWDELLGEPATAAVAEKDPDRPALKNCVLFGPPGTGKTYALSNTWVPQAAEKYGADRILICSLTRKAAQEIASRVRGIPPQNVATLHSLAWNSLSGVELAEAHIDDWNAWYPRKADSGFWRLSPNVAAVSRGGAKEASQAPTRKGSDAVGDALYTQAMLLRNQLVARDQWPAKVRAFYAAFHAWQMESGYSDWAEVIARPVGEVPQHPIHPKVIVLDEAQDFSALEMRLARTWAEASCEVLVSAGDANQAIYGFRGAVGVSFLPDGLVEGETLFSLKRSYRVPQAVHELAQNWMRGAESYVDSAYSPREEAGSVSNVPLSLKLGRQLAKGLCRDLEADSGSSIMVLGCAAYLLAPLMKAAKELGLPFANPGTDRVAYNPLSSPVIKRLREFLSASPVHHGEQAEQWSRQAISRWLKDVAASKLGRGVKPRILDMLSSYSAKKHEWTRPLEPSEQMELFGADLFHELQGALAGDPLEWFYESSAVAPRASLGYARKCVDRFGVRALYEDPQITISTIHSAKGGEADIVYLSPSIPPRWHRDLTAGDIEERDTVIRMFYVAITRARRELRILSPDRGSFPLNFSKPPQHIRKPAAAVHGVDWENPPF